MSQQWYCLSRNLVKKPGCYGASACKGLPGASVSIKKSARTSRKPFFFFSVHGQTMDINIVSGKKNVILVYPYNDV